MNGVRTARTEDAGQLAALHVDRIGDGFLASLGPRFLGRLYRRMVHSTIAFVLVSDDGGGVSGFVAVTHDTKRFYREFVRKDGVGAAAAAVPALVRAPKQVWETFRYGFAGADDLPAAEILAIAVAERAEGAGLGRGLVMAAIDELRARGIEAARVVTASDNTGALRMYERAGFRRHARTEVHAGVAQEVLVWR